MRYVSLFSGIEAASVAWEPLGWEPVAFAEIEPFPCRVLEKRFPGVPNLGDVSKVDWSPYAGAVDVVVGGSPCQAFSVAGKRKGLMDERGRLMLEYVRAVRDLRPRWLLWENVPGVLSQDGGRAFGTLLGALEDCGYALAWRVLDAQFFGVPQRRRRVFLIGHPVPGCAAGVLFEPDCMRGDNPPSREKRAQLAADAQRRAGCGHRVLPFDTTQMTSPQNGSNPQWGDPCHPLCAQGHTPTVCIGFSAGQSATAGSIAAQPEIAPTLRAGESSTNQVPSVCYAIAGNIIGREPENGGHHLGVEDDGAMFTLTTADRHAVCMADDTARAAVDEDLAGTLKCGGMPPTVAYDYIVRRLMPVECERLQGFPDGWTDLGGTPDAPRYKACGNSMAVPVIRHIGRRIEAVDSIF